MPKYFCDYCDVYLTHDSMSVRKAHNSGRNHLRNVVDYYQQIGHEKAQSVIDSITSSYADAGQQMPVPGGMMQPSFGGGMPGPPPGFPAGMPPFPPPGGLPGGPGGMVPRKFHIHHTRDANTDMNSWRPWYASFPIPSRSQRYAWLPTSWRNAIHSEFSWIAASRNAVPSSRSRWYGVSTSWNADAHGWTKSYSRCSGSGRSSTIPTII